MVVIGEREVGSWKSQVGIRCQQETGFCSVVWLEGIHRASVPKHTKEPIRRGGKKGGRSHPCLGAGEQHLPEAREKDPQQEFWPKECG